eukprot:4548553-Pyramimonas_sp.AAC.1
MNLIEGLAVEIDKEGAAHYSQGEGQQNNRKKRKERSVNEIVCDPVLSTGSNRCEAPKNYQSNLLAPA